MNSSPHVTEQGRARARSTWIERAGLPIAYSVMIAQSIGLGITFLTLLVTRTAPAPSVPISQVILLALGLLWWAMAVDVVATAWGWDASTISLAHIAGWVCALIILLSPHLIAIINGQDFLDPLLAVVLVTYFWRRGMRHARFGFDYGDLATSFKANLGFLLVLLLFAILIPSVQGMLSALEGVFPLFFVSGIIALSLARLSRIRMVRNADGSQTDPSRAWLIALTALSGGILFFVLVINAFFSFNSFAFLFPLLLFLWNGLGMVLTWLYFGVFVFLITPLFNLISYLVGLLSNAFSHNTNKQQQIGPPRPKSVLPPQHLVALPPELIIIIRWVFLIVLVLLVVWIVRKSVQNWIKRDVETTLEEERETIDMRLALRERWQEWWNQRKKRSSPSLEALDPTSIRARYRELLRALATTDTTLARLPAETPHEYEIRLATHLSEKTDQERKIASSTMDVNSQEMLHELTDAYAHERYGSARIDNQQRARIAGWLPRLIMLLTGKTSAIVTQRSRNK